VVAEAAVEAAKAAKREPLMVELAALELRTKQLHSELGSTVKPPAWLGERRTMQRERWRCVAAWMDAPTRLFEPIRDRSISAAYISSGARTMDQGGSGSDSEVEGVPTLRANQPALRALRSIAARSPWRAVQVFLGHALLPLHKPKCVAMYHQQLSYCITQFVEKDPKLADNVLRGLLKFWPITDSQKEVRGRPRTGRERSCVWTAAHTGSLFWVHGPGDVERAAACALSPHGAAVVRVRREAARLTTKGHTQEGEEGPDDAK
jgi:hypothetical protein